MVFLFEEERQSFTVFSCESIDDFINKENS